MRYLGRCIAMLGFSLDENTLSLQHPLASRQQIIENTLENFRGGGKWK